MRVCIDFTGAIQNPAGVGRYARELVQAMVLLDPYDDFSIFYIDQKGRLPVSPFDNLSRRIMRLPIWTAGMFIGSFTRFPMDWYFKGIDVFHAANHLLPQFRNTPSVYTLFDLTYTLFPKSHLLLPRLSSSFMIPRFLRSCDRIISISESTKKDAINKYGIKEDKIKVIHLAANHRFLPSPEAILQDFRRRHDLPTRYILYVGTIEPRKNLNVLLEAFRVLHDKGVNIPLVIAGKKGWRYENFFEKLKELRLQEVVIFPGYIPEEELPVLYSAAEIFLYPSLYEGFGLPVLEAMACGTPVICSNTSSLPEVAGDSATMLPPDEPNSWAEAIANLLKNKESRMALRDKGLKQAAKFSWEKTARETVQVYREVTKERSIR
jgi:glycosyltransferase involved in cell wall biosynthesis